MPVPADRTAIQSSGRQARGSDETVKRIASAAILAPVGLAALFVGGMVWDIVIALAAAGVCFEWGGISSTPPRARIALIAAVVLVTACGAFGHPRLALVILAGAMALLLVLRRAGAATSCGAAYVALPALALVWLRAQPSGLAIVLLVMLTVWSSDTGAYIVGRAIGGPKLAPAVSPSKTWSGAAGGLLAACLLGALFAVLRATHAPMHRVGDTILLACLLGIASQIGDLAESAAKRHFGVKDSGRLIPGHGGLLDRLDGLMAAAPTAALLMLA